MLFRNATAQPSIGDDLILEKPSLRWGVDSEYGRLRDVLLSAPPHLEMVPCNAVTKSSLDQGLTCCTQTASRQHAKLAEALGANGVACHFAPPAEDMPDLCFTRDSVLMTPWGLLELSPAAGHRKRETAHVRAALERLGVPVFGVLEEGRAEGGDICILRPGVVVIGYSGERTNKAGAKAVARLFRQRGWRAMLYCFDPHFLHFDTQFTLVDRHLAVACVEALEPNFVESIFDLGIDIVPATYEETQSLGANLLSLGGHRIVSSADNERINTALRRLDYQVIPVEIDQFTRCGGGIHCLTNPLSRLPG